MSSSTSDIHDPPQTDPVTQIASTIQALFQRLQEHQVKPEVMNEVARSLNVIVKIVKDQQASHQSELKNLVEKEKEVAKARSLYIAESQKAWEAEKGSLEEKMREAKEAKEQMQLMREEVQLMTEQLRRSQEEARQWKERMDRFEEEVKGKVA